MERTWLKMRLETKVVASKTVIDRAIQEADLGLVERTSDGIYLGVTDAQWDRLLNYDERGNGVYRLTFVNPEAEVVAITLEQDCGV